MFGRHVRLENLKTYQKLKDIVGAVIELNKKEYFEDFWFRRDKA